MQTLIVILNSILYWVNMEVESTGIREDDIEYWDDFYSSCDDELELGWTEEAFEAFMEDRFDDGVESQDGTVMFLSFASLGLFISSTLLFLLLVSFVAAS